MVRGRRCGWGDELTISVLTVGRLVERGGASVCAGLALFGVVRCVGGEKGCALCEGAGGEQGQDEGMHRGE